MSYLWEQIRLAVPLIFSQNTYIVGVIWVTVKVAFVSTTAALIIGLPIGLWLGLGRFRGRGALQVLANAGLALPPVLVGLGVLLILLPGAPLSGLRIEFTIRGVYVAQTLLALPYVVALTPAAIQGLPGGVIEQARLLGATRSQLSFLALREARIGVMAAVIAAVGSTLSEVAAVIIVGGNIDGHDQTLASAIVAQVEAPNYPDAIAIGIILFALILVVIGTLTYLQHRRGGVHLRFRAG